MANSFETDLAKQQALAMGDTAQLMPIGARHTGQLQIASGRLTNEEEVEIGVNRIATVYLPASARLIPHLCAAYCDQNVTAPEEAIYEFVFRDTDAERESDSKFFVVNGSSSGDHGNSGQNAHSLITDDEYRNMSQQGRWVDVVLTLTVAISAGHKFEFHVAYVGV